MLSSHKELASKLMELERRVGEHDEQIVAIFDPTRNPWQANRVRGIKEKRAAYGK
jgi:predicted nicotinamide N-methyase